MRAPQTGVETGQVKGGPETGRQREGREGVEVWEPLGVGGPLSILCWGQSVRMTEQVSDARKGHGESVKRHSPAPHWSSKQNSAPHMRESLAKNNSGDGLRKDLGPSLLPFSLHQNPRHPARHSQAASCPAPPPLQERDWGSTWKLRIYKAKSHTGEGATSWGLTSENKSGLKGCLLPSASEGAP